MIIPTPYLSMINPLLSPLLNASFPSLLNTSLFSDQGCWGQNPPGETQLVPITYVECQRAIRKIPIGDKGTAPITFGRSGDAGFEVPTAWQQGRCAIMVDVDGDDVHETATFMAIANEARRLTEKCVIKPPHLGGRLLVGEQDRLEVVVWGYDSGPAAAI